jgi:hypothetical protein
MAGFYQYPECLPCNCDLDGSNGKSCNNEGYGDHLSYVNIYAESHFLLANVIARTTLTARPATPARRTITISHCVRAVTVIQPVLLQSLRDVAPYPKVSSVNARNVFREESAISVARCTGI